MAFMGKPNQNEVSAAAKEAKFWPFFARHPDIPIVIGLSVVGVAMLCVWMLQRYSVLISGIATSQFIPPIVRG